MLGGGVLDHKHDVTYTAIQCKFFGRNYTIPKSQIDSFLAASEQECFTRRIFVCTGNLTDNALNELHNRTKPVECVSRTDLEEANVDWSGFLKTNQVTITKRKLRPYQKEALEKSNYKSDNSIVNNATCSGNCQGVNLSGYNPVIASKTISYTYPVYVFEKSSNSYEIIESNIVTNNTTSGPALVISGSSATKTIGDLLLRYQWRTR